MFSYLKEKTSTIAEKTSALAGDVGNAVNSNLQNVELNSKFKELGSRLSMG